MKYTQLGSSNLKVSAICLGSMTWGEQNTPVEGMAQMDMALDYGVNFFDVAEMYPVPPKAETFGASERIMGQWFQQRGSRDKVILATKVTGRGDRNSGLEHIRNGARLSKEHIIAACEGSLKRLQTDVIDLYQIHWPERATNFFGKLDYQPSDDDGYAIEETLTAVDQLVQQGKVRYVGVSNETAWGMHEYVRVASEQNLSRIVSIQNPYNLLNRSFDIGALEMAMRENIGFMVYSPLAFGVLSGKYLDGQQPVDARLTLYDRFKRYNNDLAVAATQDYVAIAQANGLDPSQMALAWVNSRQGVASNIIGATTLAQLRINLESIELVLTDDVLAQIDAVHARIPNPSP